MIEILLKKLEKKGYTQTRIEKETGILQSSLSRYASGKTRPDAKSIKKLVILAEICGISIKNSDFRNFVMSA